jgi:hypothetical protein
MAYKLQHMGLGGILDQAIAITKDHFVLLYTIMLILVVPFNLVMGFVKLAVTQPLPPNPTFQDIMQANQSNSEYAPLITIVGIVYSLLIAPLANAAVIHAVARLYLEEPVTALGAIKFGAVRYLPLIGTSFLMYMAIFGGMILCIIPGILFALWFGFSQHVVVVEGIAGTAALKRSKKLVRPYLGTFLVLGMIVGVISLAIAAIVWFIPEPHVKVVVTSLLQGVTYVVGTAAGVVFYFSCRCAVENFDLQYLAQSIGSEPPAGDMGVAR